MKRVLVTGVTGSVGRVVARHLAEAGFAVRAVSRRSLPAGVYDETAIMPSYDAGHADFLMLVRGVDHVVHAAALTNAERGMSEDAYMSANTGLSAALARATAETVPGRFVFLSSIRAVAGVDDGRRITDDISPNPTDAYGRSKRAAEIALCEEFTRRGRLGHLTMLRPVPVYGKGMKGGLSGMLRLADTPFPLPFGGLYNKRSLLSVDALAEAVAHLVRSERVEQSSFVVADRAPIAVADIFRAFRRGLGRRERMIRLPPGLMGAAARLAGGAEAWKRLIAAEVCDPAALVATGWQAADSEAKLAELAQSLKDGE